MRTVSMAILPVAGGVDINGDGYADVAMGGPMERDGRGEVAVFLGGPDGLPAMPQWTYPGEASVEDSERVETDRIGFSVVLADVNGDGLGDVVYTQRHRVRGHGTADERFSVLVFPGSKDGLSRTPAQWIGRRGIDREKEVPASRRIEFRETLSVAGDVNGDGCEDIAVNAWDPGHSLDDGRCLVVLMGSRDGLRSEPGWVTYSDQYDSGFGGGFASAGDVNRDGIGDFLVASTRYTGRYRHGGRVQLYLGSKGGLASEPAWSGEYPLNPDPRFDGTGPWFFGWGLGAAGDVNGDGYGDVVIGAWNGAAGDAEEGVAFLYLGNRLGLSEKPVWMVEGNRAHSHLGASVKGVGDWNGDGFPEVAVGVPYASNGQKDEGVVALFQGGLRGLSEDPVWTLDGDRSNGRLGEYVGAAGDVNGDEVQDLLAAGISMTTGQPVLQATVVYGWRGGWGSGSNWSCRKSWTRAAVQGFGRLPAWLRWTGSLAGMGGILGGLFLVHVRVRRELARVIGENRRLAAMQERTRIAQDMHDHLGADLTRLAAQLDRSSHVSAKASDTALLNAAQEAVKTLDELVWATNPTQDTLEGLAGYVTEYGPSYLNAHGLTCELDIPTQLPPVRLPSRARHELFLIVKEALRNVVQHAQATRVRLALTAEGGRLGLVVEDNGKGLTPGADGGTGSRSQGGGHGVLNSRGLGNGLANMRSRATKLGGSLSVSAMPQGGTRVSVEMPLCGIENPTRREI